jgi:hypothetical protein
MLNPAKQIVLGAALLTSITVVANAEPLPRIGDKSTASHAVMPNGARQSSSNEVTVLPASAATPTRDSIMLPSISVFAPYSHPYTSGIGPKTSPNGRVRAEHYQPPPDYVTHIAMHPYTSGVGPKASSNGALRSEHYELPADYDADLAKHPYSSGMGPPTDSPRNRQGDLRGVAVTHSNR